MNQLLTVVKIHLLSQTWSKLDFVSLKNYMAYSVLYKILNLL